MKNFTFFLFALLVSLTAMGQSPSGINYQTVIRDGNGNEMANVSLSLQMSIRSGAPNGDIVYVETHELTSNSWGLVNIILGSGEVQSGSFSGITWGSGDKFLETAIDTEGQGNYTILGVTQFLSVPYSLYATNGIHSMTTAERDALENPPMGMQIFNITTNCLNYFNGYGWYETCGDCTPLPSEADAGPDQSFTGVTTIAQMAANTPESGEGLWAVLSGEGGSFDDATSPIAQFTGQPCETYTLAWTITSPCGASEDLVNIIFDTPPSVADAGADQTFNDVTVSATLAANAPSIGTGTWSVESGTDGTFGDVNDPTTLFTGNPCETYTLKWTIANDCGTSEDFVEIIFNTPPTSADAGPDQTYNDATTSATLAANIPLLGSGIWSVESGQGGMFVDVNDPTTTFTGNPCESYTLKWTISYNCGISEDLVEVVFNTPPTTANAGPDQAFNNVTISATLAANIPLLGTGTWSIESGTGGTFVDVNDPTTTFTGISCESYTLKWMISYACGTSEDFVEIIFNTPPTIADAGTDQLDVQGTTTTLAGNSPALGTGTWILLSGSGGNIAEPSNPSSTFSGTEGVSYELQWTITNDCGTSSDNVIISFAGGSGTWECGQPVIDDRDGQQYETVVIGDQCWMAENIAHLPDVSPSNISSSTDPLHYVFGYQGTNVAEAKATENYQNYGALYNWPASVNACPDGWYSASDEDWTILTDHVGGVSEAGGELKSTRTEPDPHPRWKSPNAGATNSVGFSAFPGGRVNASGFFKNNGDYGYFWTSTENSPAAGGTVHIYYHTAPIYFNTEAKNLGYAVRCVKSDYVPVNQPPDAPATPSPEDGATNQTIEGTTLSWTSTDPENDPLNYDVHFGTENPPAQVSTGQSEATYDPGTLQYNTEYFWKIVAHDDQGNSTEGTVWSFSTEEEPAAFACGEVLTDTRDGNTYQTVQIGEQCWMTQDLAWLPAVSPASSGSITDPHYYVYGYQGTDVTEAKATNNYQTYGALYNWPAMMNGQDSSSSVPSGVQGACPDGWHLPSDEEWKMLEGAADSQYGYPDPEWDGLSWRGSDVSDNLRETGTSHWLAPNSGATNSSGFTSFPGGYHTNNGSFSNLSYIGFYWTTTEVIGNSDNAWFRYLQYNETGSLRSNNYDKSYALSVRCILNDGQENLPPASPSLPSPTGGAVNQPIEGTTLSWTGSDPENDPLTYDVYFGTENPPAQISTGQSEATYDPGTLQFATEYFWKIIAHDDQGNSTEGPVWSFTTEDEPVAFACGDIFTDSRDGNTYPTVVIGEQCWMAENLAYLPSVSPSTDGSDAASYYYVYDYEGSDVSEARATQNYLDYGVLYNWPAAQNACPSADGWHTPNDAEWKILEGNVDSQYPTGDAFWDQTDYRGFDACKNLKSTSGWNDGGNGVDTYGFTAKPGGGRSTNQHFYGIGAGGRFWTLTEASAEHGWYRILFGSTDSVYRAAWEKGLGYSIRCVFGEAPANQPPSAPHYGEPNYWSDPQPVEGTILTWSSLDADNDPITYDVYFGTSETPPMVASGQSESTYNLGTLEYDSQYFWKVIAHDNQGNTTNGPLWRFQTAVESVSFNCGEPLFDSRDGQSYPTVQIGDQCWMAKNLNVGVRIDGGTEPTDNGIIEKYCYDNNEANCDALGGLYQWNEMMQYLTTEGTQGICPPAGGWHLPSDEDWKILEGNVDSQYPVGDAAWDVTGYRGLDAGKNLKASTGWDGLNLYGFNALRGGLLTNGSFNYIATYGFWYTSTENSASTSFYRALQSGNSKSYRGTPAKTDAHSVRCVMNN